MDVLLEILFGLFVELPMEATMESKRVKTWVKTLLFSLLGYPLTLLFVLAARTTWVEQGSMFGCAFMVILALAWFAFITWAAVYGHKNKWKN